MSKKYIFYVDTGNMSPVKAAIHVKKIMKDMRKSKFFTKKEKLFVIGTNGLSRLEYLPD